MRAVRRTKKSEFAPSKLRLHPPRFRRIGGHNLCSLGWPKSLGVDVKSREEPLSGARQTLKCVRVPRSAFPRYLRPGEAHCRSLGCARDDKGRVITHLKVCDSDREIFLAIRLAEYKVSNRPPLYHPERSRVGDETLVCGVVSSR